MFRFFGRKRLVKKGLASQKVRLRRNRSEMLEGMEANSALRFMICFGFIVGLAILIFRGDQAQPTEKFLTSLLIFLTALAQLWINHPETYQRNSRLLLVLGVCLAHLALIKGVLYLAWTGSDAISNKFGPLLIPYAFAPLVLSALLGKNHGIFAAIFVSLWGSALVKGMPPAVFIVISLITGFIAVFITLQVRQRSRLIRAGVFVGLATWILALMFGLIGPIVWEFFSGINWRNIGMESLATIGCGVMTAILVSGALPILENTFRITTDISWLEAADLNHPLLKRMTIEAPGTYHHSLVVANLAEAAAESVGANATMARVCSYFHDIGKLVKPEYFTENISEHNPHNELAPTMSALIIIAHVKEGVDLAIKHKLRKEIIDVIQQHHGTSLVWYFYKRALQQQEDARQGGKIMNIREEDIPEVHEESFRYSGPPPQTRECAIISLADSVESASRSLEKVTPQRVEQLISEIIRARINDNQLAECDLTLRDLKAIAASFKSTLLSMMHSRVAYPKQDDDEGQQMREDGKGKGTPVSAA